MESGPTDKKVSPIKKYLPYALVFLAGVVLADKVRSLPVLDKLPTV